MELHWRLFGSGSAVASRFHSLPKRLILAGRVLGILLTAAIKVVHQRLVWHSLMLGIDIITRNFGRCLGEMTLESRWLRITNIYWWSLSEATVTSCSLNVHVLLAERRSGTRRIVRLLQSLFLSASICILFRLVTIASDGEIAFSSRWCMDFYRSLFFIWGLIRTIICISHRLLSSNTIVEIFVGISKTRGSSYLLLLLLASVTHEILVLILSLVLLLLLVWLHSITISLRYKAVNGLILLLWRGLELILILVGLILVWRHLVHDSVLLLLALLCSWLVSGWLFISPSKAKLWIATFMENIVTKKFAYLEHCEF